MPFLGNQPLGGVRPGVRSGATPNITNQWGYSGQHPFRSGFSGDNLMWGNYGIPWGQQANGAQPGSQGYSNPYDYYAANSDQIGSVYGNLKPMYQGYLKNWFPNYNFNPSTYNPKLDTPTQPFPANGTVGNNQPYNDPSEPYTGNRRVGGDDITWPQPPPPQNPYDNRPPVVVPPFPPTQPPPIGSGDTPNPYGPNNKLTPPAPLGDMRYPVSTTPSYAGRLGSQMPGISSYRRRF
jgi:hypothetical protein